MIDAMVWWLIDADWLIGAVVVDQCKLVGLVVVW